MPAVSYGIALRSAEAIASVESILAGFACKRKGAKCHLT